MKSAVLRASMDVDALTSIDQPQCSCPMLISRKTQSFNIDIHNNQWKYAVFSDGAAFFYWLTSRKAKFVDQLHFFSYVAIMFTLTNWKIQWCWCRPLNKCSSWHCPIQEGNWVSQRRHTAWSNWWMSGGWRPPLHFSCMTADFSSQPNFMWIFSLFQLKEEERI